MHLLGLTFLNWPKGGFAPILFCFSGLPYVLLESSLPAKRFHEVIQIQLMRRFLR